MNRLPGLALGCLLLFATGGPVLAETCSPTLFIEAIGYPTGASAKFVAVADFNGDTKPDVATANTSPRGVSILLNDGSGGLTAPLLSSLPDDPMAIAAADFRGNGTADLAVASYSGVYILLGHGDGTFDAPVFYPTDTYNISAITVGKFDANSSFDIVVGSRYSSNSISLLPGLGDGTFGDPLVMPASTPVFSLASGDFDVDGHLDLVASGGESGNVLVFPGAGDGTFGAPSAFIGGPSLNGVTTGDFDGDGDLDIATGSASAVSILLGNGSGGFEAALLYPANMNVGDLAVADFDQDGVLDIVASVATDFYYAGNLLSVLLGRGDGSFEPGAKYSVGGASSVATADLDGDGLPDVVTAGGQVFVSLDAADGSLLAVPESAIQGPSSPNYASGDWNGDGRLDFAWVTGNAVAVVEGLGGGRFRVAGTLPSPSGTSFQPYGVATGHFFDFAVSDLVVVTYSDVWLYRGNGNGTFQDPVSILNSYNLGFIAAADFDGRQFDDVVVSQGCCGSQVILNLLNHGDGTFVGPPAETPLPEDVRSLLPATMTNSAPPPGSAGTQDLVVATSNNVWVLLGSTSGFFSATAIIPAANPSSVAVGRFGGSPNDLLVSTVFPSVGLYLNDGSGHFPLPPVMVALPAGGVSVTTGDYDGDTKADFAVSTAGDVLVFLGLGAGHFQSPIDLSTETSASYLATGSLAGSYVDDITAIGQEGIATFRNSRLGAFVPWVTVLNGTPAVLDARASGYGPLSYQWRRNGAPLSDGGPISGSQTQTLTIDPVSFADVGSYDVVMTDACTTAPSNSASLSVEFADVPYGSPFHDDIITIATAGITGGCGGSDYCPTSPVRRDQMAAFLLRSEHGSEYVPPACAGLFSDVPCPSPFADWVEQLAAEGVTSGCGTAIYCPGQSVTRAQMAVFLLKTSEGSGYTPPAATGIFGDVPAGSFAADFIEDLYARGITGGCSASPLLYCPGNTVLRQQMAAFLVRTFFP